MTVREMKRNIISAMTRNEFTLVKGRTHSEVVDSVMDSLNEYEGDPDDDDFRSAGFDAIRHIRDKDGERLVRRKHNPVPHYAEKDSTPPAGRRYYEKKNKRGLEQG
jgi:hypothetical protein